MVKIDIFSSKTGAWKELIFVDQPGIFFPDTRMFFYNGAIHWICILNFHVQFILNEEKITSNPIPTDPNILAMRRNIEYFGVSGNGLVLILGNDIHGWGNWEGADRVFTVLEMDKESNCWAPKHQVDLGPLIFQFPKMNPASPRERLECSVLYVKSEAKQGNFGLILAIPEKVIFYEVKKGDSGTKTNVLREFQRGYRSGIYCDMHPYIECLAPVC